MFLPILWVCMLSLTETATWLWQLSARTCGHAVTPLIMGSLTGMGKNRHTNLVLMLIFLCVPFFISSSYHFEHVLIATKSPRKKSLLSSASQYIGKGQTLHQGPARSLLITLLRLGSFLCRSWCRRIAWKRSVASGCNVWFPGRYSCLPEGTILLILRHRTTLLSSFCLSAYLS